MRRKIEPGALYIADRGIFSFGYVRDLLQNQADFVLRIKTSQRLEVVSENPLSDQQRAAGVLSDRLVRLDPSQPTAQAPAQLLREVVILDERHPDKPVRLLSSLMEVEASLLGEVYRWRWQIELFFRWLKVHAHFRHLISHSRNGLIPSVPARFGGDRGAADPSAQRPACEQVCLWPAVPGGPGRGHPGADHADSGAAGEGKGIGTGPIGSKTGRKNARLRSQGALPPRPAWPPPHAPNQPS